MMFRRFPNSHTLKKEEASSFETLLTIYQSTRRHVCYENLQSRSSTEHFGLNLILVTLRLVPVASQQLTQREQKVEQLTVC